MKTYWQIVPIDDGYNYVIKDGDNHILYPKSETLNNTLLFKTPSECKDYINKNLDSNKFVEEKVWLNEKYYGLE
jgi:hypothetical protein